jgi:hypothetical protein
VRCWCEDGGNLVPDIEDAPDLSAKEDLIVKCFPVLGHVLATFPDRLPPQGVFVQGFYNLNEDLQGLFVQGV